MVVEVVTEVVRVIVDAIVAAFRPKKS